MGGGGGGGAAGIVRGSSYEGIGGVTEIVTDAARALRTRMRPSTTALSASARPKPRPRISVGAVVAKRPSGGPFGTATSVHTASPSITGTRT